MKIVIWLTAMFLISACSQSADKGEQNKLASQVAALSTRVDALEAKQDQKPTELPGSWILWRRIKTISVRPGVIINGPAPARPWGGFDSKSDCQQGAQKATSDHLGHGAKAGEDTYFESDSEGADRVFFTCLPVGVNVPF